MTASLRRSLRAPGLSAHWLGTAANNWSLPTSSSGGGRSGAVRVALIESCIPGNAGTTARTCAAAGVELHLVEPLGFEITDKRLKRAGLDYWQHVHARTHADCQAFVARGPPS